MGRSSSAPGRLLDGYLDAAAVDNLLGLPGSALLNRRPAPQPDVPGRRWFSSARCLRRREEIKMSWPGTTSTEVGHRQILHLSTATNTTKFPATFIDKFPALWLRSTPK
jgi:hypothetical protein